MAAPRRSLADYHRDLAIRRTGQIVPRDEYLDYMTFSRPGKPLFTEIFGPLLGLKEEWRAQGASAGELDMSAFHFRFAEEAGVGVRTGHHRGAPEKILEETEDEVIATDHYGRRVKLSKKAATLALPLDYPVTDFDSWRRIKSHYEFDPERLGGGWLDRARKALADGKVLAIHIPGGFDEPRQLMGEENFCLSIYEQPELIDDMLGTIGQTACRVIDLVGEQVRIDQLSVHEDMAGRAGPLIGPNHVRQFMVPYYRMTWDAARRAGARLFKQDSDGDMRPIIPELLESGLNFMYPFEPTGGQDIVAVRSTYGPRLAILGGLNKYVLAAGPDAITAELEHKIPPLVKSGGVTFGLDHRIPNGTPLAGYRFYHAKAWEIIHRECDRLGL